MILLAHIYFLRIYYWKYPLFFFFSKTWYYILFSPHPLLFTHKKFNPHNLLKSSGYQNIRVFFFPKFSQHTAWFKTWAGEKACLRARRCRSLELRLTHGPAAPAASPGTKLHPGSGGRCFYCIVALVRTAWGWSPLDIDMDFVKQVGCCGTWG